MSVSFSPSTQYQQWMRKLRVSWMGAKAQAIMGAFAKVLGDNTYDWMIRANLEDMPEYASPTSIGLIGSERQLDRGPFETDASYATRCTFAAQQWAYAETPLGVLMALHFGGFDGAVLVTQNGNAYQLQLPLPAFPVISGQPWNPTTSLVLTKESVLGTALTSSVTPPTVNSPGRSIPAGNSWFAFDSNTDFCSRYAVLFPGPLNGSLFRTIARATFTGSEDGSVSHPWPTATWPNVFPDLTYKMMPGIPVVTDGGGAVSVGLVGSSKATAGVQVMASSSFTGYVDVLAWQVGANPLADLHPNDLIRLSAILKKWAPAEATCTGIYVSTQGQFWDWPPTRTWDGTGGNWDPSTVVSFTP